MQLILLNKYQSPNTKCDLKSTDLEALFAEHQSQKKQIIRNKSQISFIKYFIFDTKAPRTFHQNMKHHTLIIKYQMSSDEYYK